MTIPEPISITATLLGLKGVAGALEKTGLLEAVDTTPDLTVFAPNDDAFQKVAAQVSHLTVEQLATVLGYHGQRAHAYVRAAAADVLLQS